jgi:hypothetical protein
LVIDRRIVSLTSYLDSQLFRTSAGAIKDTPTWPVPGPAVWTGGASGSSAQAAAPKTEKAEKAHTHALFVDESDFVDLTIPLPEDDF